jgi:hypothetical protein
MKASWTAPILLVISLLPASAEDLETTHLFGFTLGSDTNDFGIEGSRVRDDWALWQARRFL